MPISIGIGASPSFINSGGGAAPSNPDFISTWDTTQAGSASDTIVLPMTAGNTVHWGDGSSDTTNTHTYASSGTYTVTIEGAVNTFRFANSGDKAKITNISNWGGFDVSNDSIFRGCTNLDITATDYPIISTSSLYLTFQNCSSLTTPNFSSWDVSSVNNMGRMFLGCSILTTAQIGAWDVSSVTSFDETFKGCSVYNENLGSWNMSSALNTRGMFNGCSVFDQNLGSWDLSSNTRINTMFANTTLFNNGGSPSIDNWDTSNVQLMNSTFQNAISFNQPVGSWDTSSVTHFSYAGKGTFYGATAFDQDISGWTINSNNIDGMFSFATSFNQDIGSWDVSSVTNMRESFRDATSFDQDLSAWQITQVSSFGNFMFNVTLSTANYDALLIAWDAQGAMSYSGTVNFGGSQYTSGGAAETARTSLISKWGGITDGGAA